MTPQKHTHGEQWIDEATKLGGQSLVVVIKSILDGVDNIGITLNTMIDQNKSRDQDIAQLKAAFPDNDMGGHRRYHELLLANLEERRRLRTAIQEKTISAFLWSGIVFIAMASYSYVKAIFTGHS